VQIVFRNVQGVPEDAAVDFELELLSFDRAPNWHDAGPDEKIARAQALKEQGNAVFRQGPAQHSRARAKWMKALKMLDNAFDLDTDEQVGQETLRSLCAVWNPRKSSPKNRIQVNGGAQASSEIPFQAGHQVAGGR
jgi:hypothetical protein